MYLTKDPWEEQYIKNLKNSDVLSWGDSEAYDRYPKLNWIYDKYLLLKTLGQPVWDLEKEIPNKYPVIVKPRKNLFGLGKDCYFASFPSQIEKVVGMIAQPILTGQHISTDYVLINGKIGGMTSFIGYKDEYKEFYLWERTPYTAKINHIIQNLFKEHTGVVNVETIGGKLIEAHIRPSLQFFDIDGGLQSQLPKVVLERKFERPKWYSSYSYVARTLHKGKINVKNIPNKPKSIKSVQIAYDGTSLSSTDPSAFRKRYAIINGTDLTQIEKYVNLLKRNIEFL